AGLSEAVRGAGNGKEIVAYITVGTGVGGARIVNGAIDANAMGFEPAYQIIDADGTMIPGHRRLGRYISGAALEERYGTAPAEIKDPAIQEKLSLWLAIGLNNMIVHWSPDVVVLGGPVMNIIPIKRVRFHLQKTLKSFMQPPPVKGALLGDTGGLYGALVYLKSRL
ncbi:MAG: ROK family protein, partial [Patescibacteria group bacterium]